MSGLFGTQYATAELSPCGVYRYTLTRQWNDGERVAFLMLNPSTATATDDDPTIRKCVGFAKRWGYGSLVITNLFALRSTDPSKITRVTDPIGPLNDYWTLRALNGCRELVCAWGCGEQLRYRTSYRPKAILGQISTAYGDVMPITCLGRRKDGHPRHPARLGYTTPREAFAL